MKQITLIRHAKVDIVNDKRLNANELQAWVEQYDHASIDKKSIASPELEALVAKADIILCSTLSRTVASAITLGVLPHEKDALFNEVAIPEVYLPFFKFKPQIWLVLLRAMLVLKLGKEDSSLKASKARAQKAVQRLEEHTFHNDSIVLIGHGGMNWLIHKGLIKKGWELEGKVSYKNWGTTTLTKKELT